VSGNLPAEPDLEPDLDPAFADPDSFEPDGYEPGGYEPEPPAAIAPDGTPLPAVPTDPVEGPVDPMEWVEATLATAPELLNTLENTLHVGPDSVLPSYEAALKHLRELAQKAHDQEARRAALSRPDISSDEAALRALNDSLQERKRGSSDPITPGPATGISSHQSATDLIAAPANTTPDTKQAMSS
jgi:hypothetical protein